MRRQRPYVRQDDQGRFSLNDLHQAAGDKNRHRPSLWVENKQTQALVDEIETESKARIPALVAEHGGARPGAFVVRELVYANAMWISTAFHPKLIRTFDTLVTGGADRPGHQSAACAAHRSAGPGLEAGHPAQGREASSPACHAVRPVGGCVPGHGQAAVGAGRGRRVSACAGARPGRGRLLGASRC